MASQDDERQQHSAPTDLFGSLKIVSDAAQSTFNQQSDKVDKGEVAGAASNLLSAASQYGKLDDQQGIGKYVDQAQGYLQKYHQSSQPGHTPQPTTDEPTRTEAPAADVTEPKGISSGEDTEPKRPGGAAPAPDEGAEPRKVAADEVDTEPKGDEKEGGGYASGGVGDYVKVAQGFLGKSAGEGDAETKGSEEEGGGLAGAGVGDYVKVAQGFLGKSAGEDDGESKEKKEESGAGVGDYVNVAKGFFGK